MVYISIKKYKNKTYTYTLVYIYSTLVNIHIHWTLAFYIFKHPHVVLIKHPQLQRPLFCCSKKLPLGSWSPYFWWRIGSCNGNCKYYVYVYICCIHLYMVWYGICKMYSEHLYIWHINSIYIYRVYVIQSFTYVLCVIYGGVSHLRTPKSLRNDWCSMENQQALMAPSFRDTAFLKGEAVSIEDLP